MTNDELLLITNAISDIIENIEEWEKDDLFPPKEIFLTVWSSEQLLDRTQTKLLSISGHGGLYRLLCDWEFFGEVASVQSEIRIKEMLGTFVSEPFVSNVSDFTLLMTEESVKTAVRKWKVGAN